MQNMLKRKKACCFFAWKHTSSRRRCSNKMILNKVLLFVKQWQKFAIINLDSWCYETLEFILLLIRYAKYAKEKKIMLLFRVKTRVVVSTVFKQNDVEQGFYFFETMIKIGHCKTIFLIIRLRNRRVLILIDKICKIC